MIIGKELIMQSNERKRQKKIATQADETALIFQNIMVFFS